jgi:hypothetical protein
MKSKQAKYEEAISRNIKTFEGTVRHYAEQPATEAHPDLKRLATSSLEQVKIRIGVRQTDTYLDERIRDSIDKAIGHCSKFETKAKKEKKAEQTATETPETSKPKFRKGANKNA